MADIIEKIGKSVVHHGDFSDRLYLMKLSSDDYPEIIKKIEEIAVNNNYSKIIVKIPLYFSQKFLKNGYIKEAGIPKFYNSTEDACFLAKYFDDGRKIINNQKEIEKIIKISNLKSANDNLKLSKNYSIKKLSYDNAFKMAEIYSKVFATYPFPIQNESYIKETMDENIVYYGVFENNNLIALSSCEMDEKNLNVEMTDFACLTEHEGNGFAFFLLKYMEEEMKQKGIKTFYTIARAVSYGMNITFGKLDYHYAGTLINNTNISGGLESMNVWYKNIV